MASALPVVAGVAAVDRFLRESVTDGIRSATSRKVDRI